MMSVYAAQVSSLKAGGVQVWASWLNLPDALLRQLEATLAPDERQRAARFVFARDRQAYIASRGILRNILAHYTQAAPEALVFDYNHEGKPVLAAGCGGDWLHFNVTHSAQLALYALRRGGAVGVDVEQMRDLEDLEALAESTFSAAETAALRSLPVYQHVEAFFTCWTRKEAFIKAVGKGLSYPLKDFDVSLRPGDPPRFLRIANEDSGSWSLAELRPADGFIGAVAVPAPKVSVHMGWWTVAGSMTGFSPAVPTGQQIG